MRRFCGGGYLFKFTLGERKMHLPKCSQDTREICGSTVRITKISSFWIYGMRKVSLSRCWQDMHKIGAPGGHLTYAWFRGGSLVFDFTVNVKYPRRIFRLWIFAKRKIFPPKCSQNMRKIRAPSVHLTYAAVSLGNPLIFRNLQRAENFHCEFTFQITTRREGFQPKIRPRT